MRLKQVGVQALRAPDGSFLPAVPIYIDLDDVKNAELEKVADKNEKKMLDGFSNLVADYIKACKKEGIKI